MIFYFDDKNRGQRIRSEASRFFAVSLSTVSLSFLGRLGTNAIVMSQELVHSRHTHKRIDEEKIVIHRNDLSTVSSPHCSCKSQCSRLGWRYLLWGSVKVCNARQHKAPLNHWCPEEHCLRTSGVIPQVHKALCPRAHVQSNWCSR
jgi:hypothetical protein